MRDLIRTALWQISAWLDAGDMPRATALLLSLHPADQTDILAELSGEERSHLLNRLEPDQLAALLEHFTPEERSEVTPALAVASLAAALSEAPADTAADVLHDLLAAEAQAVLRAMPDASEVERLLAHEDESAGGIMSPHVVALRPWLTTDGAIQYLRRIHPETEEISYLYVVDTDNRLLGVVSLRDLVTAPADAQLRDLMDPHVISTTPETDQEEVLRLIQHYNLRALPVVDKDGHILGVTTIDDLLDVAQQEATEDMYRLAGLAGGETLARSVPGSVRRRLPWLSLNLLTAFTAAATVSLFKDTLTRAAVLAVFMPVIAGMGGNAGTQTLTLIVRAMALDEYDHRDWRAVIQREVLIGLLNGLALALFVGLVAWAWQGNAYLGLAVGVAMAGNLVMASLAGVLVPTILRVLRVDPALASSIFVTTVTDVMGFFFFLGLAALLIEQIA